MSDAPASTLHVVCFEEAGECTLERIAREARAGDRVLVLGPERFAERLRELGLDPSVEVRAVGRIGGAFRRMPALTLGARSVAYGPRARAVVDDRLCLAETPAALPPAPAWQEGRRERMRRELGIAPQEFAVLIAGEPSEWVDISFAIRALSMARAGGAPLRAVASPRTPRIAELGAFFESTVGARPIVVDACVDRPWECLPALDGVICDQDGLASIPTACAGWRGHGASLVEQDALSPERMSPLPALWALACGKPALVHESIDLGAHASHPLVTRFASDVAQLAREIHARASCIHARASSTHARASSASAASR
jgi:hypothetical protein